MKRGVSNGEDVFTGMEQGPDCLFDEEGGGCPCLEPGVGFVAEEEKEKEKKKC